MTAPDVPLTYLLLPTNPLESMLRSSPSCEARDVSSFRAVVDDMSGQAWAKPQRDGGGKNESWANSRAPSAGLLSSLR